MQQFIGIKIEKKASLFDSLLLEDDGQQVVKQNSINSSKNFAEGCFSQLFVESKLNLQPSQSPQIVLFQQITVKICKANYQQFAHQKDLVQTKQKDEQQRHNYITSDAGFSINSYIIQQSSQQAFNQKKGGFDFIFKEKIIKKGFKKNTNVPKFLVRIFMKHFMEFIHKEDNQKLIRHNKKAAKQLRLKPSNCYTISDVLYMLRSQNDPKDNIRRANQRIMSEIIQSILDREIVQNNCKIQNQISYMMAAKIYNLRCRSKALTERVKIF